MAETSTDRINLRVVTHDRLLLEESCVEVGLPGREGDLGILPGHTALIANLRPGELVYRSGSETHRVAIGAGFCELSKNVLSVLVEQAWLPGEVDAEGSRREKRQAEEALLKAIGPEEIGRHQDRLEAAEAQLRVAG